MPNHPRRQASRRAGFSLIELLIVMAIMLVIAAIATPYLSKQLMQSHETAAITEIASIRQAELQYWTDFGRYATSLTQLGPPTSGAPGAAAAELIPESLAEGHLSGYVFTVTGTPVGYAINADPEQFGSSGTRTFYSDQTGVTRVNYSREPATAISPAIGTAAATTTSAALTTASPK